RLGQRSQLPFEPILLFAREIPRSRCKIGVIAHPLRSKIPEHLVDGPGRGRGIESLGLRRGGWRSDYRLLLRRPCVEGWTNHLQCSRRADNGHCENDERSFHAVFPLNLLKAALQFRE